MENIKIGKIVNAAGLRGEVKVYHYSDYKERFEELDEVIVERNAEIHRCLMPAEGKEFPQAPDSP